MSYKHKILVFTNHEGSHSQPYTVPEGFIEIANDGPNTVTFRHLETGRRFRINGVEALMLSTGWNLQQEIDAQVAKLFKEIEADKSFVAKKAVQADADDFEALAAKRGEPEPAPETLQEAHAAAYGLESLLPNTQAKRKPGTCFVSNPPRIGTPPLGAPWMNVGTPMAPPTNESIQKLMEAAKAAPFKQFSAAVAKALETAEFVSEISEPVVPTDRMVSLPDDAKAREEFPMATGLLDYFPNALAEVSRLSYLATQQHHPDAPMHWDRGKSPDHRNKILRHLVDAGKLDDRGIRHSAGLAWRALANLQVELEEAYGHPLPRACRMADELTRH